jgi:hypothetical protein
VGPSARFGGGTVGWPPLPRRLAKGWRAVPKRASAVGGYGVERALPPEAGAGQDRARLCASVALLVDRPIVSVLTCSLFTPARPKFVLG